MMRIVYFSQKNQFLTEMNSYAGELLYIAPSPAKADQLRSKLSSRSGHDVITIAKFTSLLLETFWPEGNGPQVKRKAELFLIFGILKNKYLPDLGYEQFIQAYNLFSDLRSFTLDESALTTVLDEQPADIKKAVSLFWKILNLTGYLDEHAAYHALSEALRSNDEEEKLKKTFIFWGFQHLNGQQVDLLKALAIRYEVIIPFPHALKDKLKRSDWVSWLQDHKLEEKILPEIEKSPKGEWLAINSREISHHLKDLISPRLQIILGVAKLSSQHIDLIPSSDMSFKIPHEILQNELVEIADELSEAKLSDLKSLENWLSQKRTLLLDFARAKVMPFKKLKTLQLYQEAIDEIKNLTEDEVKFDTFFLKLFKDVVSLNQPRTSLIPLLKNHAQIELLDMSSLDDLDRSRKIILCIDDRFDDIQGLGQNYPEGIQKELASLGPLKRNDLELLFKQWEFTDLFHEGEVLVLMPPSVMKHNIIWKRMFSQISLIPVTSPHKRDERQLLDYFESLERKKYQGHYSASRFQTYVDCPRKFYFSYVEKITPRLTLEKDIDAMASGSLIHKIIEECALLDFDEKSIPKITQQVMGEYIASKGLKLPKDTFLQRQLIFNHRATNGVKFLKVLESASGEKISWRIEEKFESNAEFKLIGQMDCLGVGEKHLYLLDFKSSKASASTNTEVEAMESLQLWIYALAAQKKIPDFAQKSIVIGYVVLDDPSESNLLMMDADLKEKLVSLDFCRPKILDHDFLESLKLAEEKVHQLASAIQTDTRFMAKPRKANTCDFCELMQICLKVGEHV